jgi:catechol 2,3-dioxygenase-like lactoylglutathione lyase family enzyme
MKYEAICLSVKDVGASKKFYQDLIGLEIDTDWGVNVGFKGGIALQQGFAEMIGVPKESVKTRSHNMELVFETDRRCKKIFEWRVLKISRTKPLRGS